MESLPDRYPVFEANQVLMSRHLNDAFDHLDAQQRLTRSHLVGIGIVCGLELRRSGNAIALSKGCGVSSEGYLIVQPEDATLVAYRSYTPPPSIDYPPFDNAGTPYALWELFEDGVPNTMPLGATAGFLDDKAVLLFLELKKEPLRNCNPNNCDDKGSQVTVTVRRLLLARGDLEAIVAAAHDLDGGLTTADLDAALASRLDLPDLRPRRFDVPNTQPATTADLYIAFLDMVRAGGLAQATGQALSAAYAAFEPLLAADYPDDPFAGFTARYGFLDSAPATAAQVRFLPYYADFFGDLLRAYDEFRWKGLELIGVCCPDRGLFPRHLALGLLDPVADTAPSSHRQGFLPSPAVNGGARRAAEVRQLFARLVAMCASFTDQPKLPKDNAAQPVDPQIRLTPSRRGGHALGGEAIPYYYAPQGTPPLYRLWSLAGARRRRANQNLGYHADLYEPPAPDFVTDPLGYDFGPHDFLRVEGHLGKDYQRVVQSLLALKADYRLPIDVIALRTGAYDESQPVDLSNESARLRDLDALYAALRGELLSQLAEGARQLYDRPIPAIDGLALAAGTPGLTLLKEHAPHYGYAANTLGAWYEHYLTRFENQGYLDVDQNAVNPMAVMYVYCTLFSGTLAPESAAYPGVVALYYFGKLADTLAATLASLDYADFENKYQDLMALVRFFRSDAVKNVPDDLKSFVPQEAFVDLCESILMGCRLDAVKTVHDGFAARVGEVRRLQFLSSFLQREPGVQHRAGVPLGGTFIVVYHGEPTGKRGHRGRVTNAPPVRVLRAEATAPVAGKRVERTTAKATAAAEASATARVRRALDHLNANRVLRGNADLNVLLDWVAGKGETTATPGQGTSHADDPASAVIDAAVDDLANGTVIADFFLPYRLSGAGPGIEYVLPRVPPAFTATVGCTDAEGGAAVGIDVKGGVPPYDVAVDGGAYRALASPLRLAAGEHSLRLRDATGAQTVARNLTVAPPIAVGEPSFDCADGKYTATAPISGGVPPYLVDGKAAPDASIVTAPTPSGTPATVTVTDSKGCALTAQFTHTCPPPCTLPCGGASLKRRFRFFLPDPDPDPANAYQDFALETLKFVVEAAPGKPIDLSHEVAQIIVASKEQLSAAAFPGTVKNWLGAINTLVAKHPELAQAGKARWLTLGYEPVLPRRPGVLTIDYFECLGFDIRIVAALRLPEDRLSLDVAYSPQGTSIRAGDLAVEVPAFDGTSTDKCDDTAEPKNLCPVPPAFTVQIEGEKTATLKLPADFVATSSVPSKGLRFVWEVQDGTPAMGSGLGVTTVFGSAGTKLVTVTAFDARGCSATATLAVQVARLPRPRPPTEPPRKNIPIDPRKVDLPAVTKDAGTSVVTKNVDALVATKLVATKKAAASDTAKNTDAPAVRKKVAVPVAKKKPGKSAKPAVARTTRRNPKGGKQ